MKTYVELTCSKCSKIFLREKKNTYGKATNVFCSSQCNYSFFDKKVYGNCAFCKKETYTEYQDFKKNKSGNIFCNHSCAASYNNTHKTHGTRVSKLEVFLKKEITKIFPNIEIHYNRKDVINNELDIYIPSLKLAFELNGIFHYKPIYGEEKFKQIQINDKIKSDLCIQNDIKLIVINTYEKQKRFTKESSMIFLEQIKKEIESFQENI